MLKKIPVNQVEIGMFIHEICGSWMDHPFWKKGFLLKDAKELHQLTSSSVTEVWIDTTKGLDCRDAEPAGEAGSDLASLDIQPEKVKPAAVVVRECMAVELKRAAQICAGSKKAVMDMFGEARLGRGINSEQGRQVVQEISLSVLRHPNALLSIVRVKQADEYTYMHSVAVCALMIGLARQMGLSEEQVQEAGMAGLLHDVGKMGVEDAILNKPGSLTDDEFAEIKRHPEYGVRYLQKGTDPVSREVLVACYSHHEKMDGSGYPRALKSNQISLLSRMAAVCDVYDALTSDRPYKEGWGPSDALQRMAQWTGHFDPIIFQAFVRSVGIYPVGSLVRLKSGRLAVVMEQSEKSLLVPRVKAFFSVRSGLHIEPKMIDLASSHCDDVIEAREPIENWSFRDLDELWREQ